MAEQITNKDSIIVRDIHCPYCDTENALLINSVRQKKIGLQFPAYGLKYVLSLLYLSFLYMWIHGYKTVEVTKKIEFTTYGFCPKCGNSFSAAPPETIKEEIHEPKFYKILNGKAITGLCKGISEYTGISLLWVRIMTVLYGFTIIGAFMYFIISACIPSKEDFENGTKEKRYYKAKQGKAIMGVCKGFSEYTDIPVMWIRILTVILCLTVVGLILYFIIGAVAHTEDEIHAK